MVQRWPMLRQEKVAQSCFCMATPHQNACGAISCPISKVKGTSLPLTSLAWANQTNPIPYRYHHHYRYLAGFIDALGLTDNITLVLHDWGSGLGFNFAAQNAGRKAIAFMEALVQPIDGWQDEQATRQRS